MQPIGMVQVEDHASSRPERLGDSRQRLEVSPAADEPQAVPKEERTIEHPGQVPDVPLIERDVAIANCSPFLTEQFKEI